MLKKGLALSSLEKHVSRVGGNAHEEDQLDAQFLNNYSGASKPIAIKKLWDSNLFSSIEVYATKTSSL